MQINKGERQNGMSIYRVEGDIDINTSPEIKKTFDKEIKSGDNNNILINFKDVNYVDSSGLATLVEILKNMRISGGKLKLTNLSTKVRALFEITKLDKLFDISQEEDDALKDFGIESSE